MEMEVEDMEAKERSGILSECTNTHALAREEDSFLALESQQNLSLEVPHSLPECACPKVPSISPCHHDSSGVGEDGYKANCSLSWSERLKL
jgi:hypothetical protein